MQADAWVLAGGSALWLGVLTAISPCPLATNIAAMSFIGRHVASPARALAASVAYTVGRAAAYLAVAGLVVAGLSSVPRISDVVQRIVPLAVGPLLILVGMVLLDLLTLGASRGTSAERWQRLAQRGGWLGALLLGAVFALSFCPVSAALFFGSLVPLALEQRSVWLLPGLFGLGTALPVLGFAVVLAVAGERLNAAFQRVTAMERWARRITGAILIAVGLYLALRHNFGLLG